MDRLIHPLQHWFAVAQDSTQDMLIHEFTRRTPAITKVYDMTQQYYRDNGITTIHMYRCDSGIQRVLTSWTPNRRDAEEYQLIRKGGTIIEADIPVASILIDTRLGELYYEDGWDDDDVLGMMPCDECIVITNIVGGI